MVYFNLMSDADVILAENPLLFKGRKITVERFEIKSKNLSEKSVFVEQKISKSFFVGYRCRKFLMRKIVTFSYATEKLESETYSTPLPKTTEIDVHNLVANYDSDVSNKSEDDDRSQYHKKKRRKIGIVAVKKN